MVGSAGRFVSPAPQAPPLLVLLLPLALPPSVPPPPLLLVAPLPLPAPLPPLPPLPPLLLPLLPPPLLPLLPTPPLPSKIPLLPPVLPLPPLDPCPTPPSAEPPPPQPIGKNAEATPAATATKVARLFISFRWQETLTTAHEAWRRASLRCQTAAQLLECFRWAGLWGWRAPWRSPGYWAHARNCPG
jgi:hypothetical protein